MEITALARFPVKSMGGESCDELVLEERGAVGDRVWAVLTADGFLGSGKSSQRFRRLDGLLHCSARSDDPVPVVTLPDGSEHLVDSEQLAALLSAQVGQPVTLAVEGDVPHHDDSPVHVASTLELDALAVRLGGPLDPRRFRANILVDGPIERGMRLALGDGPVLVVGEAMPRCVMVTMSQPGVAEDRRVLREMTGVRGPELGFMAYVERSGSAAVGDPVLVLP